jgi:hypothetical protein
MGRTSTRRTDAAALPTFPTPAGAVTAAPATSGRDSAVPTQRGPRQSVCPQCAGTSVTRLQMTLPDGGPATFVSCHDCETKGWFAADGAALPLAAGLGGSPRG